MKHSFAINEAMKPVAKPLPGQSKVSGRNDRLRIKYDPEWSPSKPWSAFVDGTAIGCYPSERTAEIRIAGNMAMPKWSVWR